MHNTSNNFGAKMQIITEAEAAKPLLTNPGIRRHVTCPRATHQRATHNWARKRERERERDCLQYYNIRLSVAP